MKELPIGYQDFEKIIRNGFLYIDKTKLIHRMVKQGEVYFFLRPRRFGKTLLISTLAALFRGQEELFADTWIASSNYEWQKHPVVRLDFGNVGGDTAEEFIESLNHYLQLTAQLMGFDLTPRARPAETLQLLIHALAKEGGVVLLIDEYDRPLIQHLENPERTQAKREALQSFFTAIKSLSSQLRFVFITGVSKFTKVSLFSGLNHLNDISLHPDYATLLGITEQELRHDLLEAISRLPRSPEETIDLMRQWYNGYLFSTSPLSEKVYNPWSLFNYLQSGSLKNYWFTSATPTFAVDFIRQQNFPIADFDHGVSAGSEIETSQDIGSLDLVSLLFQTGYLTVDSYDAQSGRYQLTIPNREVRQSLYQALLHSYTGADTWQSQPIMDQLTAALRNRHLDDFFTSLNQLLAAIPYPIHVLSESYYHSLIFLVMRLLGFNVQAEVMTSDGRIDLVVETEQTIYVMEFKIDNSARQALKQIKKKDYAQQFRSSDKAVILVGANIDSQKRTVDDWAEA